MAANRRSRCAAPPGYAIEVVPFESPTDGKNAVLTGTVDTCVHGIAAFLLGAAAGEPVVIVAAATNRGMGIVADAKSDIKTIQDLKGKRVAITPGSTQEVVILERLIGNRVLAEVEWSGLDALEMGSDAYPHV